MKYLIFVSLILAPLSALAAEGDWFFYPHGAFGYNTAQGSHFTLGVDGGYELRERLRVGLGGYYAAGERPAHDREYGVGPFVSYVQPVTSFLMILVRQEINYVDLYDPYRIVSASGTTYGHTEENGVASETSASMHIFFTPNFVLSGGYRFVLGLSNDKLDDGRSGAFLGLSLGF